MTEVWPKTPELSNRYRPPKAVGERHAVYWLRRESPGERSSVGQVCAVQPLKRMRLNGGVEGLNGAAAADMTVRQSESGLEIAIPAIRHRGVDHGNTGPGRVNVRDYRIVWFYPLVLGG
jgi:hypothetical protein